MCGEPALIIHNGHVLQTSMRHNRLTLDELLEELRGQGVTDLNTVKHAVLETSGKLSVLLYPDEQPATPKQMGLKVKDDMYLPTVIINDGRLIKDNLTRRGFDDRWLQKQLQQHQAHTPSDIFYLAVDDEGTVLCLPKEEQV